MNPSVPLTAENVPLEASLDAELLRRSRAGDLDAFDRIVAFYYGPIYRLTFRMLGGRELAEDATQEVFVKAWSGLRRFHGDSRFLSWLYAIAVNQCLDVTRKQKREVARCETVSGEDLDEGRYDPPAMGPLHGRWDERLALKEALARLPENERIVLALHFYAGHSLREVAETMNEPVSTVHHWERSALKRLARLLKEKEG